MTPCSNARPPAPCCQLHYQLSCAMQELMASELGAQLTMDGQISSLTYICTKTDQISPTESAEWLADVRRACSSCWMQICMHRLLDRSAAGCLSARGQHDAHQETSSVSDPAAEQSCKACIILSRLQAVFVTKALPAER